MDDELDAATSSTTTTCNCNCGSSNGSDDNDSKPNWIKMSGILFAAVTVLGSKCNIMYALTKEVLSKRFQEYTQEDADKCCLFSTRPRPLEYTRGIFYLGPSEAKAYICYGCSHCSLFCIITRLLFKEI